MPDLTTEGARSTKLFTEPKLTEVEKEAQMRQLQLRNADLEDLVQRRTNELASALKERDVQLQEVHHRVKNNLQILSSLLGMQARTLDTSTSRDALEDSQARIQAIALIHEHLYRSKEYGRLPFSAYARGLVASVVEATGVSRDVVSLDVALGDLVLPLDKAIPCGLVLNELVTNAIKHGLVKGRAAKIDVELVRIGDDHLRLAVRDNGLGLPAGFDIRKSESLGLHLVCTLADQLEAVLDVNGRQGASFQLTFPIGPQTR